VNALSCNAGALSQWAMPLGRGGHSYMPQAPPQYTPPPPHPITSTRCSGVFPMHLAGSRKQDHAHRSSFQFLHKQHAV
jgi:hypothetical protein